MDGPSTLPSDELAEEKQYLQETLMSIDQEVEQILSHLPAKAAYTETAIEIQRLEEERLGKLQQARPSPYFARVDFRPAAQPDRKHRHYIGKFYIPGRVWSWEAPVAALYYRPGASGYNVGGRVIQGRIELKREFQIRQAQLISAADILRLEAPRDETVPLPGVEGTALDRALGSTGASELSEIVETIRPEQYEEIAAGECPVMILQGAAGSGKSLVGLHRIAYLLSPFSEIGRLSRPRADRVIMLGPTRAFLAYVSNLLPSLGHRDIKQTTLRAWMLESFSEPVTIDHSDRLFRDLMDNRRWPSNQESEAQLFKGSKQMADLLERHVKEMRKRFAATPSNILVHPPQEDSLELAAAEVGRLARDTFHLPLNDARSLFISSIVQHLQRKSQFQNLIEERQRFRDAITPSVEEQVDSFWPKLSFMRVYACLLADPKALQDLGRGTVNEELAQYLAHGAPSEYGPFSTTDLPPLLYLDHLLNTHPSQGFEHIVIDEAQDISPLEVMLLKQHSANGSFTIMGDIKQRLLPYRGIRNWREISVLFPPGSVSRYESRISYRSTAQITRFANHILRQTPGGSNNLPVPYPRQGEKPRMFEARTQHEMLDNIARDIQMLRAGGAGTIAVLSKWTREAKVIFDDLRGRNFVDVALLDIDGAISSPVTVAPVLLTKGLEFDAVILAGVQQKNFTGTEFDKRLLYLGCSRARHWLHIHWSGRLSDALKAWRPQPGPAAE